MYICISTAYSSSHICMCGCVYASSTRYKLFSVLCAPMCENKMYKAQKQSIFFKFYLCSGIVLTRFVLLRSSFVNALGLFIWAQYTQCETSGLLPFGTVRVEVYSFKCKVSPTTSKSN